jgi:hypothetical protein
MASIRSQHELTINQGWRLDPRTHPGQLTHAVPKGRATALCGVHIDSVGAPWPEPSGPIPAGRCPGCAHAVTVMWTGETYL